MARIVNVGQSDAWNGYEGGHWADHDTRFNAVNSGYNEAVLTGARIGAGGRVLDIGCGTGQLTRLAARRGRAAAGLDLSEPMLAKARDRAAEEGVANVRFERGDAQVHPFEEGAFDAVVSRFGVMFFADPVAAFGNIRRALAPGGRLAFVCMTDLEGTDLGTVFGAMAPYLPPPAEADAKDAGPTSLAEPDRVRAILTEAGYLDLAITEVEADQLWGLDTADAAAFMAAWGPVKYHLGRVDAPTADKARAALAEALLPMERDGAVRLRSTAWLVTGAVT
ncbi:class I SAM-dependent methyltransferase [Spirillospora sp. CA-294931]|uniref:class I SAM-dependent methyltransferase n=1 Tax=Spirillospora sp. CA-294931 TaxID=3240042 RepID=UPI003D950758